MADPGIKKTRIKREDLPSINADVEGYVLRYRVISEDKNITSHWSPVETLIPGYSFVSGTLEHSKAGGINTIAWTPVNINKNSQYVATAHEYDIWVRWGRNSDGDWLYLARIDNTTISFPTPTTYTINGVVQAQVPNRLSVEIYLKGSPINRDSAFLRVYQGGPWTT